MNNDSTMMFKIIEIITGKLLENMSYDKEGMVLSKVDSGKYKVIPNGEQYPIDVINGTGIELKRGDKCLIHYVNGNENKRVIIANYTGKTVSSGDSAPSTPTDIQTITPEQINRLFQ